MLGIATDDWNEKNALLLGEDYFAWALGENQWTDDDKDGHPYLGCNNDRMGHVPKGVIGIRMDGMTGISFDGLHIYDLHEQGALGSPLCGEYWDSDMSEHNYGGPNIFQNTPYLYGYTGNYVHGIFSDFAEMKMSGDIKFEDIKSDTGLARAIGFYPQSTVSFADDATLSISKLSAGHRLYDHDTESLKAPYNPTVAKPVHVIWTEDYSKYSKVFNTTIDNAPSDVSFSCIYGRDGVDYADWELTVDNSDCAEFEEQMTVLAVSSVSSSTHSADSMWIWKSMVLMSVAGAVLLALYALYSRIRQKPKRMDSECAPLLRSDL